MNLTNQENQNIFSWIQKWYAKHCNDDWEHQYGLIIETLDNPGWSVTIDLLGTEVVGKNFSPVKIDRSEDNWVHCRVEQNKFTGACGPLDLKELLEIFRSWVESFKS